MVKMTTDHPIKALMLAVVTEDVLIGNNERGQDHICRLKCSMSSSTGRSLPDVTTRVEQR